MFLDGRQREDHMLRTFEKGVVRKKCMSNMDKVTEAGENRIPNGLMAWTPHQNHSDGQIEDGAHETLGIKKERMRSFGGETYSNHMGNLDIDGTIILKRMLKKLDGRTVGQYGSEQVAGSSDTVMNLRVPSNAGNFLNTQELLKVASNLLHEASDMTDILQVTLKMCSKTHFSLSPSLYDGCNRNGVPPV